MRKRMYFSIITLCGIAILMLGCSDLKQLSEVSPSYMYTVAFNDIVYGITNEEVGAKQMDHFMGETQGVVSPKVSHNGEMGCRVSECAPPPGNKFYSIKELDPKQTIAIETPRGSHTFIYYKCVNIGKITTSTQKFLKIKAIYYVSENGGEISTADLEQHAEIKVVHRFADLKAASKAGIAIWIDKNVADQVNHQWLNESPQLEIPIVLVGYNNALYSFREVLDAFGIEGPSVDWSKIQLTPGFSVWLWKEHKVTTKSAWNKGYNQSATVEHIEVVIDSMLTGYAS
jgi:hypothetical protein